MPTGGNRGVCGGGKGRDYFKKGVIKHWPRRGLRVGRWIYLNDRLLEIFMSGFIGQG